MADSSPLAGLLDRAGNVFSLAGKLGRAYHEGHKGQRQQIDPAGRKRHAPAFDEFCAALLDLRDAMQNPPDGFAPVAEPLLQAARIAKGIRDAMQRPDLRTWASYLEFFPHLNSVSEAGWRAVKEVTKARRLDDPFAFVDEPAATPAYSLLDRFPATPEGHVAFLERVRDEVHNAAEAKRQQTAQKYSNDTLVRMVQGIKWAEAGERIIELADLGGNTMGQVAHVLRRKLSIGTVEQIDDLLTPAVRLLRAELESGCDGSAAMSYTLGDLLRDLIGSQSAYDTNMREADRLQQVHGSFVAHHMNFQASVLKWCPDRKSMHGIDRIELICNERFGTEITAEAVRRLRADVCRAADIDIQTANALCLNDAADILEGSSKRATLGVEIELIEQLLSGSDDVELTQREFALLEAYMKRPISPAQKKREAKAEGMSETASRRNKLKLIWDFNRCLQAAIGGSDTGGKRETQQPADSVADSFTDETPASSKSKRSTERGEGRAKLIATLTKHHKYADGSCLTQEHIGNNELARQSKVSESTASAFFTKEFGGHTKYRRLCGDATSLVAALKLLNQEFSPHHLFGGKPPGEDEPDEDE